MPKFLGAEIQKPGQLHLIRPINVFWESNQIVPGISLGLPNNFAFNKYFCNDFAGQQFIGIELVRWSLDDDSNDNGQLNISL